MRGQQVRVILGPVVLGLEQQRDLRSEVLDTVDGVYRLVPRQPYPGVAFVYPFVVRGVPVEQQLEPPRLPRLAPDPELLAVGGEGDARQQRPKRAVVDLPEVPAAQDRADRLEVRRPDSTSVSP